MRYLEKKIIISYQAKTNAFLFYLSFNLKDQVKL